MALAAIGCLLVSAAVGTGQTTNGSIRGKTAGSWGEELSVPARIECHAATGKVFTARSGPGGYYTIPLLPPGTYWIRAEAEGYQRLEVHNIEVPVAGTVEQPLRLRRLQDVFEAESKLVAGFGGHLVRFHGPDVDLGRTTMQRPWEAGIHVLEPSISNAIDAGMIGALPLAGRDSYTMLTTQAAVTSDSGTNRSLGLTAAGQRPASSNFLLDGLEMNNSLITGTLASVPPEALDQYRFSIAGYSAEFGQTGGYLANAVTRAGGSKWSGIVYHYMRNEFLNANDFQNNATGKPRPRLRERQTGYAVGGPVGRGVRLFSSWEEVDSRGQEAEREYALPNEEFLTYLRRGITSPEGPFAKASGLLEQYRPPVTARTKFEDPFVGFATLSKPVSKNRGIGIQRADAEWGGTRLMGRFLLSRSGWPNFIWTPYRDFVSGQRQDAMGAALQAVRSFGMRHAMEARGGYSRYDYGWERAKEEFPTLTVRSGNPGFEQPLLPGSPAAYSYRNRTATTELGVNYSGWGGRHMWKAGVAHWRRGIRDRLPYARAGRYDFDSLVRFASGGRAVLLTALDRAALAEGRYAPPIVDRRYFQDRSAAFVQDSVRMGERTALQLGARWEIAHAPAEQGPGRAPQFELGRGASLAEQIGNGGLHLQGGRLHERSSQVAMRVGISHNLGGDSPLGMRPVVRAGYGQYFDHPFDNTWLNVRNNGFVLPANGLSLAGGFDYTRSAEGVLSLLRPEPVPTDFPSLTVFARNLQPGVVHTFYAGLQSRVWWGWVAEANVLGAEGRGLLTTDTVNRQFSVNSVEPESPGCDNTRSKPCLPDMAYRGNAGWSSYRGLTLQIRGRGTQRGWAAAYTLSRSMDNQSDPLRGDFFDLSFGRSAQRAGFSKQYDAQIDRGLSDYDQRQSFVFHGWMQIPGIRKLCKATCNWQVAGMGAARTGFPFTVRDVIAFPSSGGVLLTRRAELRDGVAVPANPREGVAGGMRILQAGDFCLAPECTADRSRQSARKRNSFRGPGITNMDASVARIFAVPRVREGMRITLRADVFNVLNHANLGEPETDLTRLSDFGVARYGRRLRDIGYPTAQPLQETGRQVQLLVRFEF
jgi:hypothetical protein